MIMRQRLRALFLPYRSREEVNVIANASLSALIVLFGIFATLALTDAAQQFLTDDHGNSYGLQFWVKPHPFVAAAFALFVFTLLKFAHSSMTYLSGLYDGEASGPHGKAVSGFQGKHIWPIVDFFFLFVQSFVVFVLSHTFNVIRTDALPYFVYFLVFLALDVLWCLAVIVRDWLDGLMVTVGLMFTIGRQLFQAKDIGHLNKLVALRHSLGVQHRESAQANFSYIVPLTLNSVTLLAGFLILWFSPAHVPLNSLAQRWYLVYLLAARAVVDFILDYRNLYPDAFGRPTPTGAA